MSDIQAVFERINDVESTITTLERQQGATDFPRSVALRSLRARRDELLQALDELSRAQLVDVCDYKIIPDAWDRYPVKAVADAIGSFQEMFTAFFASAREKRPRHRAVFDADIVQASTLNLGYSYSGSLGLVLYTPSDQFLLFESDQDIAIHAIFELAKQETSTGVRGIAETFGRAPVRKFYEWSQVHVAHEFAADIKWKRGPETKDGRLIQPAELRNVLALINEATDTKEDRIVLEGILVALDVTRRSFKLSFPDSPDIRGDFDEHFNWQVPHEIPGSYRATLRKKTTTPLWSDVDTTTWTLIDLQSRQSR